MDYINAITDWEFLNEPLYRWALFWFALMMIGWSWNGILDFMRS